MGSGFDKAIKVLLALNMQLVAKPSAGSSSSGWGRRENNAGTV
jgi:hypothetical protein